MKLDEALMVIYKSYSSLDELINPFKLKSRLDDLCNDSFENKRLANLYIDIMERVNLMNYLINYPKSEIEYTLKNDYRLLRNVSVDDYRLCCEATIYLKYSPIDFVRPKYKKTYKAKPGQLLYYTTKGERVYHISPTCPGLINAKNIMYKINKEACEVHVCERCRDFKRNLKEEVKLNPIDRMYAWVSFGRSDKDIHLRRNGNDLTKTEIKDEILKRRK